MPGELKTISSGDEKTVVGTDATDNVWLFNGATWDQAPGKMTQVSVGLSGMWAVDKANKLYYWDDGQQNFVELKTGVAVTQVASGQDVYILDTQRNIFKYQGDEKWIQLDGKLDSIDTSDYGDLWGIQVGELKRAHRRINGGWVYVLGPDNRDTLKQVSTGISGVWAVDSNGTVYRWVNSTRHEGAWVKAEGSLKSISAGYPLVWGLDTNGKVYKYSSDGTDSGGPQKTSTAVVPVAQKLRVVGEYVPTPGPRHSAYPAHLDPTNDATKLGDYLAYSNELCTLEDVFPDPGPGKRERIGLSTGVCTVIQEPSAGDPATVFQCQTSLQFQSGKYAGSSIFLAIVYSDGNVPAYAILGGTGYFKNVQGQATQVDETPFAAQSPHGEYYIDLEYYLPGGSKAGAPAPITSDDFKVALRTSG
ncbi:hypothetical protein KFL_005870070 [Klebsormidium nitens]|uniref:Uncharacterized protein n=1 Tax=Klebsormidium nitens TaxID=105231 RepID=A0A1Y1IN06_KLENI|nr:hypothetical protein KFL_005870070 [Klebsormidium nitens]|eukprot:GAQ89997.1 hypothetical protein KFL_005870070 [Klebsormidium nitens]